MKMQKLESVNGFSLVEVLVAMLVLSVGVIGVMAVFPQAYRDVTQAGRVSTLNHLGYKKMDELKTLGFGNAALAGSVSPGTVHSDNTLTLIPGSSSGYYYSVIDPGTSDPPGNEYENYSIKWNVISDFPITGVSTVIIETGWGISYDSSGVLQSSQTRNATIARYQFCISTN